MFLTTSMERAYFMKKTNFFLIIASSILLLAGFILFFFNFYSFSFFSMFIGGIIILISYIKSIISVRTVTASEQKIVSGDLTTNLLDKDEKTATREVLQSTVSNFENIVSLQKYASKGFKSISDEMILNIENSQNSLDEIRQDSNLILDSLKDIDNSISRTNLLSVGISGDIEMLDAQISTQVMMIENSSEALNEMTTAISQLDRLSVETNQSAALLLSLSNEGKDAVDSSATQIEEIERQANKIEEMVFTINKISKQTRILAMNAEIEAAHAGEVGKGFAVVADEVRKLAEDSDISSREIRHFVKDIIELIKSASEASSKTIEAFSQIDKNINGVCVGVEEITKALNMTSQKSNGLLQNIQLVREISDIIGTSSQDIFQNASQITNHMNEIREKNNEIAEDANINIRNLDVLQGLFETTEAKLSSISEISSSLSKGCSEYITFDHPEFE
jgi:methyl-accepting chemotaxis protein